MLLDENKTFPVSTTVRREAILKCKQPSGKVRVAKFTDVKRIVTGQQKNDLNFQSALNNRGIYIISLQFMGNITAECALCLFNTLLLISICL